MNIEVIPIEVKGIKGFEIALIQHIFNTAKHSYNVHYNYEPFREASTDPDPDIPHDVKGKFNKYEPAIAVRLALEYVDEENKEKNLKYRGLIMEGVETHRNQFHHKMWASSSLKVPKDSRLLSGVDAICAQLEPRKYQGGTHSWEEIEDIIAANETPHQRYWMEKVYERMRKVPQPDLAAMKSFRQIPKKYINAEMHDMIIGRAHETLHLLELDHGYNFYKNSESIIRNILK